jgi:hypothetical protein
VDGEHLLDECPSEVQQPQWESSLILCAERGAGFLQELTNIGTQVNNAGGFAATCCPGFEENATGDFARSTETLRIGEAVVATESANGLALLLDKRKRRVRSDSITEFLEFAINAVLSQGWFEPERIEEDVDVF